MDMNSAPGAGLFKKKKKGENAQTWIQTGFKCLEFILFIPKSVQSMSGT